MLIGLHGRAGAGKDTVYERLVHLLGPASHTGATVERRAFADAVYACAAVSLGVDVATLARFKNDPDATVELYGAKVEPLARLSVRRYLQNYGQEFRVLFGEDFWVSRVPLEHDRKIVVITDVRYANEAQAVSDAGGHVLRVLGPPAVEDAVDPHESEAPLSNGLIDHTILNHRRDDRFAMLDWQLLAVVLRLLREERGRC